MITLGPLQLSLFSLIMLAACRETPSSLDGHYEDGSRQTIEKNAGLQRVTAEYEASQGVIISFPLVRDFSRYDLVSAILKAGVDSLWITVPSETTDSLSDASARNAFSKLKIAAGDSIDKVRLVPQQTPGSLSVWARDWAPLSAAVQGGGMRLLDFNYYPERPADDFTPQSFERLLDFDRMSVPVYNEGGNFMNNSLGHCMMTARVTQANAFRQRDDDEVLTSEQIQSYYSRAAGCKNVTIFPRMPYEGTGHIDMWAKFLDDKTLIVSELRDEVIALYPRTQKDKTLRIQQFFNNRASEMEKMGYTVLRIPIPGPVWTAEGLSIFRSYTNSLLVNQHALVPRYVKPNFVVNDAVPPAYLDEDFRTKYEAEVEAIYESRGYTFTWIPSDGLIARGGAVHCTTMQIAR